jgi:hypothetical protein
MIFHGDLGLLELFIPQPIIQYPSTYQIIHIVHIRIPIIYKINPLQLVFECQMILQHDIGIEWR